MKNFLVSLASVKTGLSTSALWVFDLDKSFFSMFRLEHKDVYQVSLDICPLDTSSAILSSCNKEKRLQTLPDVPRGAELLLVKTINLSPSVKDATSKTCI